MGKKKLATYWACDFETTVWGDQLEKERGKKQDETEVWSSASTKLYDDSETVYIQQSIRDWLEFILSQPGQNIAFFHNLSFDGSFILDFLLRNGWHWTEKKPKDLKYHEFTTSISDMGQWYKMVLKANRGYLEIRNSLKLMPKSLKAIGKSFGTKHQKLDMEYTGDRHAYCEITDSERQYIENDVLVLKEALEMMFNEGHNKLTIGSCCLAEYKSGFTGLDYKRIFPGLKRDTHTNTRWENYRRMGIHAQKLSWGMVLCKP